MPWTYDIEGTAANDQTWRVQGEIDGNADPVVVVDFAMRESFSALTRGKAVFGKPGVGCNGPYKFKRILLVRKGETDGS